MAAERYYRARFLESVEISIGGGYEHREFENSTKNAPYGELTVSVPLFSRQKEQEREEARRAFLKEASGYLEEIEEGIRLLEILKENARIQKKILHNLDQTMRDTSDLKDYETRIETYLNLNERIIKVQAQIRNAERKLEAMLGGTKL